MNQLLAIEEAQRKAAIPAVRSGDSVRVHQLIKEGSKQRVQIFHGVVIKTARLGQASASLTVRRIASGVGVEKTFLLHSPNITKVEVIRRAKVRRNFLVYLRGRHGKSARLTELGFDRAAVNVADEPEVTEAPVASADPDVDLDADALNDAEAEVTESTDQLAAEENAEAATADASADPDNATDEAELPEAEIESGLDRADAS